MSILEKKHQLPDPKKIRALAIDLDGTALAPGPALSPRTERAVKLCKKRGIRIILATGRAIDGAEPFRATFGAEGPMVYYNGAIVVDMPEKKILKSALLGKNEAEYCVDLARDMEVFCQMYLPEDGDESRIRLMCERDYPEREMYYRHTGIEAKLVDLKEVLSKPDFVGCVKTMFLAEPEVLARVRPKLEEHLDDSVYIAQSHRTFLEVLDAEASKGLGLKFVMEHCGIKKEEIIAFGDEENDIPMFKDAGFSVAPSNANDNVKAVADLVVASNSEDGMAAFLEDFFEL